MWNSSSHVNATKIWNQVCFRWWIDVKPSIHIMLNIYKIQNLSTAETLRVDCKYTVLFDVFCFIRFGIMNLLLPLSQIFIDCSVSIFNGTCFGEPLYCGFTQRYFLYHYKCITCAMEFHKDYFWFIWPLCHMHGSAPWCSIACHKQINWKMWL